MGFPFHYWEAYAIYPDEIKVVRTVCIQILSVAKQLLAGWMPSFLFQEVIWVRYRIRAGSFPLLATCCVVVLKAGKPLLYTQVID
jgi:hypothetical protein